MNPNTTSDVTETMSVSIVIYRPDRPMLDRVFATLALALRQLMPKQPAKVFLIDNGAPDELIGLPESAHQPEFDIELITGHGNVGYGCGHNLAIERIRSRYHLVLNPDTEL